MKTSRLKALLEKPENRDFITSHLKDDVPTLLLKYSKDEDKRHLIYQIASRQAVRKKLPSYYESPFFVFPPKRNLEQSSSEAIARFKAQLFNSGDSILDLSAGFGIDFRFLADRFENGTLVEPDGELLEINRTNLERIFPDRNFVFHKTSAEDFLKANEKSFDLIYLDPSRRDEQNNRLQEIESYQPDFLSLKPELLKLAKLIYVKLSPMISIPFYLEKLKDVSEVWILSERNECKEVGFLFKNEDSRTIPTVRCWNLHESGHSYFESSNMDLGTARIGPISSYLYLPNSSILKAGLQDQCASKFDLVKLDPNSHLYSSDILKKDFPGRIFKVKAQHKAYAKELKGLRLQIISRNFDDSPEKIQQKLKLKSKGAKDFLIATRANKKPIFLHCEWIFNSLTGNVG